MIYNKVSIERFERKTLQEIHQRILSTRSQYNYVVLVTIIILVRKFQKDRRKHKSYEEKDGRFS